MQAGWCVKVLGPISTQEKFPRTENFPKISLFKSWKFSTSKFFSHGKFVSANHILQIFLSAENFPEWKWAFTARDGITWGGGGQRSLVVLAIKGGCQFPYEIIFFCLEGNILPLRLREIQLLYVKNSSRTLTFWDYILPSTRSLNPLLVPQTLPVLRCPSLPLGSH
jgi:hypothetical protein